MPIDERLASLGYQLPEATSAVAAYVPTVQSGGLLYVAGQLPYEAGAIMTGKCGDGRDEDYAQKAAERCGLMLLAQIRRALGSLDRVGRVVKLGVFVASTPEFTAQAKVANGASKLMESVFGESGRHVRSTVGVAALPLGAIVEVDAIVEVKG